MRGQFVRGDGLVIPNNVSMAGAEMILGAAFRHESVSVYCALVRGTPTVDMVMGDMVEPTIGVNGYSRVAITQDSTGWPVIAAYGTEMYIESSFRVWVGLNDGFSEPIQRIALVGSNTYDAGLDVWALSAPMPEEVRITPSTPLNQRRFKYQLFL